MLTLVYGPFVIIKPQTKKEKNILTKLYMIFHRGPLSILFDGNKLNVSLYMV